MTDLNMLLSCVREKMSSMYMGAYMSMLYISLYLQSVRRAEFLAPKHENRILGHSSNSVCGFSMMDQVRLWLLCPWRTGLALPALP